MCDCEITKNDISEKVSSRLRKKIMIRDQGIHNSPATHLTINYKLDVLVLPGLIWSIVSNVCLC